MHRPLQENSLFICLFVFSHMWKYKCYGPRECICCSQKKTPKLFIQIGRCNFGISFYGKSAHKQPIDGVMVKKNCRFTG